VDDEVVVWGGEVWVPSQVSSRLCHNRVG